MSGHIRYFTKSQLAKANSIAIKRGYNRALAESFVDGLSDWMKYPICHHMIHEHKRGEACERHIRVVIVTDDKSGPSSIHVLDCDWNLFYELPAAGVMMA